MYLLKELGKCIARMPTMSHTWPYKQVKKWAILTATPTTKTSEEVMMAIVTTLEEALEVEEGMEAEVLG